VITHITS